ncbi:hypothetical protein AVEN_30791-1 [Araneus ventricosus]|uniref:RNase H type-1 domain-containing protein n=1 Tax=Araneus ventricosus TaxID=182803 RepID=A0A4Y2MRW8_ARAVE|nr:hypothetical protein AVEN_30791-1 [Araneus ventricosus]
MCTRPRQYNEVLVQPALVFDVAMSCFHFFQVLHCAIGYMQTHLGAKSEERCQMYCFWQNIAVSWIKVHAGYIGNEEEDRLAKEASETEKFPETPFELPKSFIRTFLRQKMMATWQMAWDNGDTGRLINNIMPKVSLEPINWTRNEVLFFTEHGPFPSFLQRFNLPKPHSVLASKARFP